MASSKNNLEERIANWKRSLLDMTKRNRLLWYKPFKSGSLKLDSEVFDTQTNPIEAILKIINGDRIEFSVELPLIIPEPHKNDPNYVSKLKDFNTSVSKQEAVKNRNKALEIIRKNINNELNEKGLNIGYIAVGFLEWFERDDSTILATSPLILVPIKIDHESRKEPYVLSLNTDEEIAINPVIIKKLNNDYGIDLNIEQFEYNDISKILDYISEIIKKQSGWKITEDIVLDTFNYQNLVIWNDLDKNIDIITESAFGKILAGESPSEVGISYNDSDIELKIIKSSENLCILETDSSQLEAIVRARNGESFVIQGPPGTGKSQTIVNIIAEHLYAGKKVLFVSEKQAALDVVHNKLESKGLGDYCLIMHNAKQKKTDVRMQLQKSLDLAVDRIKVTDEAMQLLNNLDVKSNRLDLYAELLHEENDNGLSAYNAIGNLSLINDTIDLVFNIPDTILTKLSFKTEIPVLFNTLSDYAESFVDNTKHFAGNQWSNYTGEFTNTTKRIVEESIDSFDRHKAMEMINQISESNVDIDGIFKIAKELSSMINKIPFKQIKVEIVNDILKNINDLNDKTLKLNVNKKDKLEEAEQIEKAAAKQTELIHKDYLTIKKLLLDTFTEDFLKLNEPQNVLKTLNNKYGKLINRLSNEYKNYIHSLDKYSTSKLKYKDYVYYIERLIEYGSKIKETEKIREKSESDISSIYSTITTIETEINTNKVLVNGYIRSLISSFNLLTKEIDNISNTINYNLLEEYRNYTSARKKLLDNYSLDSFINTIEESTVTYTRDQIPNIFKKRYYKLFIEKTNFSNKFYDYARYAHDQDVNIFREYDKKALQIASLRIQSKLSANLPNLASFSNNKQSGEIGLLRRELKKKTRLMPTRKLIEKLPITVPQIKPCMMMSPITVSSYFGTNTDWKFDLVIFDEASQVRPEYAIPAIARGKQIIIAGDSKQMPPTRFFDSSEFEDDEYIENESNYNDLESILDEASSVLPDIYLNWHYRSKDESLITFSNISFYNSRLYTFPSAYTTLDGVGVDHIYCDDGIWENRNGNRNEAELVARTIFKHITSAPNQSLGVIAFGKSQEYAIEEAVNKLRDMHPEIEEFFNDSKEEPFFIKNLENVQGDQRDRIILSCGYGKDPNGTFAMRFGPLTLSGGERRLNVAVTRAKYRMTVVSSFKASEIRGIDENSNRKLLRDFIDYADRGIKALLGDVDNIDEKNYIPEFDSTFEEDVYNFISRNGFKVRTQVGSSGYRIDLAICHPKIQGKYVLAIECDGAAYHSSRTARDRDILRQEILENIGWEFYRIWSTNWINDNFNEKERLLEAINNSLSEKVTSDKPNIQWDIKQSNSENFTSPNEGLDNVDKIYKKYRNQLVKDYGQGYLNDYGHFEDNWNSLYVMGKTGIVKKILTDCIKYRSGYSPEDLFREINEKVFDKSRYTPQAAKIYEREFKKLIKNNTLEVVGNSIRNL